MNRSKDVLGSQSKLAADIDNLLADDDDDGLFGFDDRTKKGVIKVANGNQDDKIDQP